MIGRGRFVLAFLIALSLTLYAMVPLLGTPLDDEHLRSLTWMDAVPLLLHGLFATYFVCVISRLAALRDSPSGVDSLAVIGSSSAVTAWVTSWNYAPMHALAQQVYFDSAFSATMFVPVVNAMMWASLMTFGLVTIARFRKPVDEDELDYAPEELNDDAVVIVERLAHAPALPPKSKKALSDARRRRRELAATIPGQEVSRDLMKSLAAGVCVYCGSDADHADHIRPVSRGGWHHEDNLVPACEACNTHGKNSKLLVEWMRERPDLVMHGCMKSPLVLLALASEIRELDTMTVRLAPATDLVRNACERYNLVHLIPQPGVVEVPRVRYVPELEPAGVPFPPVRSEDTEAEVDAAAPKRWTAIGRRKGKTVSTGGPRPNLVKAWAEWEQPVVADIRRDHQPCVTSPPAVGDERCDEPELSLL